MLLFWRGFRLRLTQIVDVTFVTAKETTLNPFLQGVEIRQLAKSVDKPMHIGSGIKGGAKCQRPLRLPGTLPNFTDFFTTQICEAYFEFSQHGGPDIGF